MKKPGSGFWRWLGLEGQRVLIVHHDDLGITNSQNNAYYELRFPTGSVMMPGCCTNVRGEDIGVHLTLTSEWVDRRLTPLTAGPSLRDSTGHFWPTVQDLWSHVDPVEAANEMRAQLSMALQAGIDVTHLDTHMGAAAYPELAAAYHRLALDNCLPVLLPEDLHAMNLPSAITDALERLFATSPLPKFGIVDGYLVPPEHRQQWYIDTLSKLGPGVYHLMHHAATSTSREDFLPDQEGRRADLAALQSVEVRRVIGEFLPLSYREIRSALRGFLAAPTTQ